MKTLPISTKRGKTKLTAIKATAAEETDVRFQGQASNPGLFSLLLYAVTGA